MAGWRRPNVLRALCSPAQHDRVLEVGAGAGSVTRWIAEQGALVDALEPDPAMADSARRRCADLADAWILGNHLGQGVVAADYDLVVDLEGLAHAGGGSAEVAPYVDRLRLLARHLAPGGTLVFGATNRLGVPALAGQVDPFTGRPWDGPNEYPTATTGRGFTRAELHRLLASSGLDGRVLGVAPDVVTARMVFSDELFDVGAVPSSLAWQVPDFPTPATADGLTSGPDQRRMWRSLVDAGLGPHFAPAFLVVASLDGGHHRWWPSAQLGAFWSMERRSIFCAESRIVRRPDAPPAPNQASHVHIERRALAADGDAFDEATLRFRPDGSPLLAGVPLQELLAGTASPSDCRDMVAHYAQAVADLQPDDDGRLPIDAVPFNLLRCADGTSAWIDQEWWMSSVTRQDVLARGLLASTLRLARAGTIAAWGGGVVGEVALHLGRFAGFTHDDWLAGAVVLDSVVQTQVCHLSPDHPNSPEVARQVRAQLVAMLQGTIRPLSAPAAGRRHEPHDAADHVAMPTPAMAGNGFRLGRGA